MFSVLPSCCSAAPPWFAALVCCGECDGAFLAVRSCSVLVCGRKRKKSMVALCRHFKERLFTMMESFEKKFCSLSMKMLVKSVTGTGLPLPASLAR